MSAPSGQALPSIDDPRARLGRAEEKLDALSEVMGQVIESQHYAVTPHSIHSMSRAQCSSKKWASYPWLRGA